MAWTTPASYSVGEIVTASKMNTHVRDNLRYLKGLDGEVQIENVLNIGTGSGNAVMRINGSGANARAIAFRSTGSDRWDIVVSASAEDFTIGRYNGAGVFQDQPFIIDFATGRTIISKGFQATQGPGGFFVWGGTGIGSTPVTILSTGINRRVSGSFTARHSSGTGTNGALSAISGSPAAIYGDGTNTVTVSISGGAMTIYLSSGSGTWDVTMMFAYQ